MSDNIYRIVSLKAENFKRLKAVDITPDPDQSIVTISGVNGAGKSSVLEAIWAAMGGKAMTVENPVHNGEKSAVIRLDLGDIQVQLKFNAAGERTLSVIGGGAGSPQEVLNRLYGKMAKDPLAFLRMKPKDQAARLFELVPLSVDLDALADKRAAAYEARTKVNGEVTRLNGLIQTLTDALPDTAPVPVNLSNVMTERRELEAQERAYRESERAITLLSNEQHSTERSTNEAKARVEAARVALVDAESALGEWEAVGIEAAEKVTAAQQRLVSMALPDFAEIDDRLERAEEINASARQWQEREEAAAERKAKQAASDALTQEIADIDKVKKDALAAANFPVPGMGYADGSVTLLDPNGNPVPLSSAASSEQLRAAIAIEMTAEPPLRVMPIRGGESLDSKSVAILDEMASARKFQVWMERVDETGKCGIVMSEGQVVAVN